MAVFKSHKHVFWQALVLTLIVFNIGVYLGYSLEAFRAKQINKMYIQSELELLDIRIQNEVLAEENIGCEDAIEENIKFADKIYEDAKLLKKYEDANRINGAVVLEHKKYDLLRTFFWLNSMNLKERCSADYHIVVYFYQYNNPSLEKRARQKTFSNLLGELKQKYGNKIMLIPVAGDLDLSSINLMIKTYSITELPVILIDGKIKLTELQTMEDMEKYLK